MVLLGSKMYAALLFSQHFTYLPLTQDSGEFHNDLNSNSDARITTKNKCAVYSFQSHFLGIRAENII